MQPCASIVAYVAHNADYTNQWTTIHSAEGVRGTQLYLLGEKEKYRRGWLPAKEKKVYVQLIIVEQITKKPFLINAFSIDNI